MQSNTPSGQESAGEQREKYHVVCRDCPHEELFDEWGDAVIDAHEHVDDEPDHKTHFEGIE